MTSGVYKRTAKMKENMSDAKKGKKNPKWKGDDVKNLSVRAIHTRIKKIKPKPENGKCEICHQIADEKGRTKLALSNIKKHHYTLNPDDYQWAHHSCHSIYDVEEIWTPEKRKEQSEIMIKSWTPKRKKEFSENNPMKRPEIVAKRRKNREIKAKKLRKSKKNKHLSQVGYWLKN